MREIWRNIEGFTGYQVSNTGRVRSFWRKKHYPTGYGTYRYLSDQPQIMSLSDDGNGYTKVMLYSHEDGRRYCRKVHRLVAEAFLPHDPKIDGDTVDHIESGPIGKLNNRLTNLRWMSRSENIRKAYRDGVCDARIQRQNKPVVAFDIWTGEEYYFDSINEASDILRIHRSSISHNLLGDQTRASHYIFEYAGREERLLYGRDY